MLPTPIVDIAAGVERFKNKHCLTVKDTKCKEVQSSLNVLGRQWRRSFKHMLRDVNFLWSQPLQTYKRERIRDVTITWYLDLGMVLENKRIVSRSCGTGLCVSRFKSRLKV